MRFEAKHSRATPLKVVERFVLILSLALSGCSFQSLDDQLLEEAGSPFSDIAKVKDLLAKGAKVDSIDNRGQTALMKAASMGRVELIRTFLDAGADVKHVDHYGYTALMEAVQGALLWSYDGKPMFEKTDHDRTLKLLIASGVNVNASNHVGATALQMAIEKSVAGHTGNPLVVTSLVKTLLEGGADPEAGKLSVLFTAVMNGQTGAVQALLESHKVKTDSRNGSGETAFMLSVRFGHLDIARSLAGIGADVNAQDEKGQTALMVATDTNDAASTAAVLELKADANKGDKEGRTALHRAVAKGEVEIVKLLLAHNADPNLADSNGMTPLKSAVWSNRTDVVDLLKNNGAKQ